MPLFEYRCESCGHRFEALVYGAMKTGVPEVRRKGPREAVVHLRNRRRAASGRGDSCSYRTRPGPVRPAEVVEGSDTRAVSPAAGRTYNATRSPQ